MTKCTLCEKKDDESITVRNVTYCTTCALILGKTEEIMMNNTNEYENIEITYDDEEIISENDTEDE